MILPSVNVALLEFVSGTLRLASGGPSNWFWYAWSSCPSIGRFQMIQKWVIPPCLGSECTQCNNQLKVIQGHFRSFSFKELLPGYDSCILSYEKNKFCSIKKWLLDINPLCLLIRFERFDSVYDLPVDPEPVHGTMTGIEPIRIRPLDCSMLRMVAVTRLKDLYASTICVIMIRVLLSVWFCDIQ